MHQWVRKHVKDPWITKYTEILTGPQDAETIASHAAMLSDARGDLHAIGSLVQSNLKEALLQLATENTKWNVKDNEAEEWAESARTCTGV